jgi:hypothetical protein
MPLAARAGHNHEHMPASHEDQASRRGWRDPARLRELGTPCPDDARRRALSGHGRYRKGVIRRMAEVAIAFVPTHAVVGLSLGRRRDGAPSTRRRRNATVRRRLETLTCFASGEAALSVCRVGVTRPASYRRRGSCGSPIRQLARGAGCCRNAGAAVAAQRRPRALPKFVGPRGESIECGNSPRSPDGVGREQRAVSDRRGCDRSGEPAPRCV